MRWEKNRFIAGRLGISFLGVLNMKCILDASRDGMAKRLKRLPAIRETRV